MNARAGGLERRQPFTIRWFLGVEDHLPRKIERIGVMYSDRITGSILTIWDLRVDRGLGTEAFSSPS